MLKRILKGAAAALLALVLVAAGLYLYGGMQAPSASVRSAYAADVAAGTQPPVEARFVIPVPGCVCHSDDPVLQMQHSNRRMSECGSCHGRG